MKNPQLLKDKTVELLSRCEYDENWWKAMIEMVGFLEYLHDELWATDQNDELCRQIKSHLKAIAFPLEKMMIED